MSYVRDDDVLLTPGGGRWTRNLRQGEPVPARLEGRPVHLRPELVRDADEVERLLRRMLAANSRLAAFVPFAERVGRIDRDGLAQAVGHGFCIVRWRIDSGSTPSST